MTTAKVFRRDTSWLVLALVCLAALVGMALVVYATRYGPGVGGDATIYLTTARNFLAGKGLGWVDADGSYRLLPYTPPFYPLVLSAAGLIAKNLVSSARWLNVLFFGVLVLLAGCSFFRFTQKPWLAVLLAGTLATSPVLLGIQVWAMSEPVFLLAGFAGLLLLLVYSEVGGKRIFFASAGLVGLAFLARYIGVAYVATAVVYLLVFSSSLNKKIDIKTPFLYGLVAILPTLVWLVVDFALTGTIGSRSGQPVSAYWQRFTVMGPALEKIYLFWLLPESLVNRLPEVLRVASWLLPLLGLSALMRILARRAGQVKVDAKLLSAIRLVLMLGLFTVVYLLVLAVVQVFTYPPITLAARMLSPVHLMVIMLVYALVSLGMDLFQPLPRSTQVVVYVLLLAVLSSYALRGFLVVRDYHRTGIGYTAPSWQTSVLVDKVKQLPPGVALISNDTTALMFLIDRPAYPLLEIFSSQPLEKFTLYGQGSDASQRVFQQGGALILFNASLNDDFSMYGSQVDQRVQALTQGLYVYYQDSDGAIYFASRPEFENSPMVLHRGIRINSFNR